MMHWPRPIVAALMALSVLAAPHSLAKTKSRAELEYGTVLFNYYQQDYFNALIEQAYNTALDNPISKGPEGQVLKGGMLLSYGVPDGAHTIFNAVLSESEEEPVRNRAWYYLAKLYYNKSETAKAVSALQKIQGAVPKEIHLLYHYLATLVRINANHLDQAQQAVDTLTPDTPFYPYLKFNMAIGHLREGHLSTAVSNLEAVTRYAGQNEELSVLADRAKHGLSQLAIQTGNFPQAWLYLRGIRTTGLYSNRALLSYSWAAIKLKRFNDAIPALEILNSRSIAIPEVQEAKVLLSHLYEQQGLSRKALKANLLAEKAFKQGVDQVAEARRIIGLRDVPREFISNLEAIVDDSDWYGTEPTVNYHTLTPFLIDLMASHAFNETLKDLADLYAIHDNLTHWAQQANQHLLILENSSAKNFSDNVKEGIHKSLDLRNRIQEQSQEFKLHTLTLEVKDQQRFEVLLKSLHSEMDLLDDKIDKLQNVKAPYVPPANMKSIVLARHQTIQTQIKRTEEYITVLEPIMRNLVKAELDKHEERMRYYWAQSRLAKARLYDSTLLELERARGLQAPESDPSEETP